jgi:hypothetical protein
MKQTLLKAVALTAVVLVVAGSVTLAGDKPRVSQSSRWSETLVGANDSGVADIVFTRPQVRVYSGPQKDEDERSVVQSSGVRKRILEKLCVSEGSLVSTMDMFGLMDLAPRCRESGTR